MGRVQPGSLCFKEQIDKWDLDKWDFPILTSFLMKLHMDLTRILLYGTSVHLCGCVKTAGTRSMSGKEPALLFVLCQTWYWILQHSLKPHPVKLEVFANSLYRRGHRDSGRLSNLPVVHSKNVGKVDNLHPCD